jgi:hypothetical protein
LETGSRSPERVNALSKNLYSSVLPGYLSNDSEYMKLERIIPSPTQILRESMNGEKYCIYIAFEERVPQNKDEHSDYVCPTEQVFRVNVNTPCKCKKSQDI